MTTKFRISAKHFMLTFKTHLLLEKVAFLSTRGNTHKIFYEVGESGYKHTHMVISFKEKFESRNPRCFDVEGIHPHIKTIKSREHWNNCIQYDKAKKKEGRKYNVISNTIDDNEWKWLGTYRTCIQEHTSWRDVINDDDLTNVVRKFPHWAREVFDNKPKTYRFDLIKEYGKFLDWQEEVLDRLKNQDKRKVIWIYDKKGNNGKSELADHLEDQENAFIVESGNYKDIAYLWNLEETIVFDLVRTTEDFTPYRAIEAFLKGRITSTKYKPVRKRLNHNKGCKIIVFSNYLPERKKLSLDRWDIGHLNGGMISWEKSGVPPGSLNIKEETLIKGQTNTTKNLSDQRSKIFLKNDVDDFINLNKNGRRSPLLSAKASTRFRDLRELSDESSDYG